VTPSPSAHEADAWQELQDHRTGRSGTQFIHRAAQSTADWAGSASERGAEFIERHGAARAMRDTARRGAHGAGRRLRRAASATPDFVTDAAKGAGRALVRLSQIGLTPERVIRKHQKAGHSVATLRDIRAIDLEQVDLVLGRNRDLAYSSAAALVGGTSSFVITGGEIAVVAGAGAGAAPGGAVIAGAFVADTALLLAIASRAVGEISLLYGYDPTQPTEKPFILSVINLGTAVSASSRTAALADISRVTQLLVRGATWKKLNEHAAAGLTKAFAARFGVRLTKKGLGKAIPALGVAIGASLNWLTIEQIVDSANIAYRRRWLLEKYPHLAEHDGSLAPENWKSGEAPQDDAPISVVELLEEQGLIEGDEPA
jgi:EcsC protein family